MFTHNMSEFMKTLLLRALMTTVSLLPLPGLAGAIEPLIGEVLEIRLNSISPERLPSYTTLRELKKSEIYPSFFDKIPDAIGFYWNDVDRFGVNGFRNQNRETNMLSGTSTFYAVIDTAYLASEDQVEFVVRIPFQAHSLTQTFRVGHAFGTHNTKLKLMVYCHRDDQERLVKVHDSSVDTPDSDYNGGYWEKMEAIGHWTFDQQCGKYVVAAKSESYHTIWGSEENQDAVALVLWTRIAL